MQKTVVTLIVAALFSAPLFAQEAEQITQQNSRTKSSQTTKNRTKTATVSVPGPKVLAYALGATPLVGEVGFWRWRGLEELISDLDMQPDRWAQTKEAIITDFGAPRNQFEVVFLDALNAVNSAEAAADFALRVQTMRLTAALLQQYSAVLRTTSPQTVVFSRAPERLVDGPQATAMFYAPFVAFALKDLTAAILKTTAAAKLNPDAAALELSRAYLNYDAAKVRQALIKIRSFTKQMPIDLTQYVQIAGPQNATLSVNVGNDTNYVVALNNGRLSVSQAGGPLFDDQVLAGLRVEFSASGSNGTGTTDSTSSTGSRSTGKIRAVQ